MNVLLLNFLLTILQIGPAFRMVTATISPVLLKTGSEKFWHDVFYVIQKSCECVVSCDVEAQEVTLKGSLSGVIGAEEILKHQWTIHNRRGTSAYQNNQNFNEHDPHNNLPSWHNTLPTWRNTQPTWHNTLPTWHNTLSTRHNTLSTRHNTQLIGHYNTLLFQFPTIFHDQFDQTWQFRKHPGSW